MKATLKAWTMKSNLTALQMLTASSIHFVVQVESHSIGWLGSSNCPRSRSHIYHVRTSIHSHLINPTQFLTTIPVSDNIWIISTSPELLSIDSKKTCSWKGTALKSTIYNHVPSFTGNLLGINCQPKCLGSELHTAISPRIINTFEDAYIIILAWGHRT